MDLRLKEDFPYIISAVTVVKEEKKTLWMILVC